MFSRRSSTFDVSGLDSDSMSRRADVSGRMTRRSATSGNGSGVAASGSGRMGHSALGQRRGESTMNDAATSGAGMWARIARFEGDPADVDERVQRLRAMIDSGGLP